MDDTTHAEARARLIALRDTATERVRSLEHDLDALVRARRTQSDDDEHDPDGDPLSSQWSMLTGLIASARDDAQQADEAIDRLDSGDYGVCVTCGQPIPARQLEVRPFRRECVSCAEKAGR